MTRSVFMPGEDHSAELMPVNATIDRHSIESDTGLLTTEEFSTGNLASAIEA
ncbi:hypothetical protein [Mycobacterium sp. SMC-11]|uniref:hypothetical protein n=1 Tax=Mycobacterium sp. SMC-11 TaxID=3385969 RepID=UPI00390CB48E